MKKTVPALAAFVALIVTLPACKPTEKNYKAAYDAAKGKREQSLADRGVTGPLQSDDSYSIRVVDGDSVWVGHDYVSLRNPDDSKPSGVAGRYGVAVAAFKMPTNARAMTSDLKAAGHGAWTAVDGRGKVYVLADLYPDLQQAAAAARRFSADAPSFIYVGVPAPTVMLVR